MPIQCGGSSPHSDLLRRCAQVQQDEGRKEEPVPDQKSEGLGLGTFTRISFPCPSLLRALSYLHLLIFILLIYLLFMPD
jgi:hypothetical protein